MPALAKSWDVNGANVTLHLRDDVKWTNGKTVTADDVVWSWLRTISPQLGADYAYQFYGIKGAQDYNSCKPSAANQQCNTLKSKVAHLGSGRDDGQDRRSRRRSRGSCSSFRTRRSFRRTRKP